MKKRFGLFVPMILLCACAETYLNEAEENTAAQFAPNKSLIAMANSADALSQKYVIASRKTAKTQDAAYALVFLSAGAVAIGSAGTTSSAELTRRAAVGVTAERTSSRISPKSAMTALLDGATRLNCMSTVGRVGVGLGVTNVPAARAVFIGGIRKVQIELRKGLIREDPDYSELLAGISGDLPAEDPQNFARQIEDEEKKLNTLTFIKLVNSCFDVTKKIPEPPDN